MADDNGLPDFEWNPGSLKDIFDSAPKPLFATENEGLGGDAFIVETIRLLGENPMLHGVLVMYDEVECRVRYMLFNHTSRLESIDSLTKIITRLVDLERTDPS